MYFLLDIKQFVRCKVHSLAVPWSLFVEKLFPTTKSIRLRNLISRKNIEFSKDLNTVIQINRNIYPVYMHHDSLIRSKEN